MNRSVRLLALREDAARDTIHQRLGVTMMYHHDQAEALTLSDRIAVFEGGRTAARRLEGCMTARRMPSSPAVGENNLLPGIIWHDSEDCNCAWPAACRRPRRWIAARLAALPGRDPPRTSRSKPGDGQRPGGALPAVLREAIFLGDHVRLRLSLGDAGEILAKRPAGVGALPEPGGPAAIAWPEGAAFAFRAAG